MTLLIQKCLLKYMKLEYFKKQYNIFPIKKFFTKQKKKTFETEIFFLFIYLLSNLKVIFWSYTGWAFNDNLVIFIFNCSYLIILLFFQFFSSEKKSLWREPLILNSFFQRYLWNKENGKILIVSITVPLKITLVLLKQLLIMTFLILWQVWISSHCLPTFH